MRAESASGYGLDQLSTQNSVLGTQPPQSVAPSPRPRSQGLQEYNDEQPRDDHGKWTVGARGVPEGTSQRDNIQAARSQLVQNGTGNAHAPVHNDSGGDSSRVYDPRTVADARVESGTPGAAVLA